MSPPVGRLGGLETLGERRITAYAAPPAADNGQIIPDFRLRARINSPIKKQERENRGRIAGIVKILKVEGNHKERAYNL